MGVIRSRRFAFKRLKKLVEDPSKVLVIHYSQFKTYDDEYGGISPIICAVVIKSLDKKIEKHFSIHLEADKGGIPIEEVENFYPQLEMNNLKNINDFFKRHKENYIWVHWNMKNIHFGFEGPKASI